MQNRDCFLEQPDWQDLLATIASDNDAACPPELVNLWRMMAFLPRLLRQTSNYLLQPATSRLDRGILIAQLRTLKHRIYDWRTSYLDHSSCHLRLGPALWKSLYGVGLGNLSIINRFLLALRPTSKEALSLEEETQELAAKAMTLKTDKVVTAAFYVGMIAKATRDEWMDVAAGKKGKVDRGRDVINADVFVRWNAMMGRGGKYGSSWPDERKVDS
jgi:hypothetical protein